MMLPERYPDPQHLPFNRTAFADFRLQSPGCDPGGEGLWLALEGSRLLVTTDHVASLPAGNRLPASLLDRTSEALFMGLWGETPCRVLRLPDNFEAPDGFELVNLLAANPRLDIATLSLAGLAAQVLHWHDSSHACSHCGAKNDYLPKEWGRVCSTCRQHRYPAVHPCIIVLISRPKEVLLVRKPEWVPDRYSLVAGFVEYGECLEECVHREVAEEVGITIRNLRYAGSQSWPFPSQLMTGFSADYEAGEIILEREELENGGWFSVDNLPQLPPKRSIARWLIDRWVSSQERTT